MKTPKANTLYVIKSIGGKRSLWHARHREDIYFRHIGARQYPNVIGAGNTADNAIKDYQKQFRAYMRNHKVSP